MKRIATTLLFFVSLSFMSCSKDYDYEIGINEQIVIELEHTEGTGYSWYWDKQDNVLDTVSEEFISYDENMIEGSGIDRWIFVGVQKGTTTIRLNYKRPWETTVLEKREYSVKVR